MKNISASYTFDLGGFWINISKFGIFTVPTGVGSLTPLTISCFAAFSVLETSLIKMVDSIHISRQIAFFAPPARPIEKHRTLTPHSVPRHLLPLFHNTSKKGGSTTRISTGTVIKILKKRNRGTEHKLTQLIYFAKLEIGVSSQFSNYT